MTKKYTIGDLQEFLEEFGLTPKQAALYLAALRMGPSSVQALADEADIQRTNAYDALGALVTKGLVSISTKGKKKLFAAQSPAVLKTLLAEKETLLADVVPQLESLHITTEHKPRIFYYPGIEGYKRVYEDSLTTKEGKLFGIFAVQDMWEVLGREYADKMVARRIKAGIPLRVIRSRERDAANVYPSTPRDLREMRYAPPGMVFPITTYVYDNKVIILSSKKETFGLLIESADIAQAHRNYFEALWQISEAG
ncbi:MAG: transcriptional regulator TrmB [Candidatus Liptonbacteria bacterium]|nr:transcriptional regulator TrmB [Candidatus Liptonbacteria bacterium]